MKAAFFKEYGGPEKLIYGDFPDPNIGRDEVLIRVKACSLNHLDIWVRQGVPAYKTQLPHISGSDVSGVIEAVGGEVQELRPGMRVIVSPGISCFKCPNCLSGNDNLCDSYTILGAGAHGGYAQFIKVRSLDVIPIPEDLTFEEAAAFPLTFVTAWHMLMTRCQIKAGQDVLVLAAGSGIGSAAVQIAKLAGARVITTAGSAEKCERAKALGADEVVDYHTDDFSRAVRIFTQGRGADVVFEHVGPETWSKSIQCLAKNGKLVTCGATTGKEVPLDLRYVFSRQLSILGSMMGCRFELLEILKLIGGRKLKPVIDSSFPLLEARQAQEKLLDRRQFGKILLLPS
jgi:NADPH:quinone reductase-like Zn-dependent oxidoreductase